MNIALADKEREVIDDNGGIVLHEYSESVVLKFENSVFACCAFRILRDYRKAALYAITSTDYSTVVIQKAYHDAELDSPDSA